MKGPAMTSSSLNELLRYQNPYIEHGVGTDFAKVDMIIL